MRMVLVEIIIYESLALYQCKHFKGHAFAFENCWVILQEMPCWVELQNDSVRTHDSLKRKCFADALVAPSDSTIESLVADESTWSASVTRHPQSSSSSGSKRFPGMKQTKEDLGNGKMCEQVAHPEAQASLEMARATRMKAQILQDAVAQQLFGINIVEIYDPMACEYYALRRDEELLKLNRRLQEPKSTLPATSETNVVHPSIPHFPLSSHHAQFPPVLSNTSNT